MNMHLMPRHIRNKRASRKCCCCCICVDSALCQQQEFANAILAVNGAALQLQTAKQKLM